MNQRERLLALLRHEPVDRVPIWLLFPYHPLGCYGDVRTEPSYRQVFEASRSYAVHLNRRNFGVSLFTPDVTDTRETLVEDGWTVQRRLLTWQDVRLAAETRRRGTEVQIKKLVNDEADLEAYCSLPVLADAAAIHAQLGRQLPKYQQELAEFPMELGAMMLDLGEPIGTLYGQSNLSEYPIWSLTRGEMIESFLSRVQERIRVIYSWCLEHELADVYFLVGSELASPPMVGVDTFQRWIVPHAKELIKMVHSAGCYAIQHYHGQISAILPYFREMGPDALHTIESPPVGDCTLSQAYDVLGEQIALIGNVQYDEFRSNTPDEMREAVRRVLEEVDGRPFMLSPSAGPYEATLSDRMVANYLAFMEAGREYGAK
jgi:uroporphyrinogen-III decarboxylase